MAKIAIRYEGVIVTPKGRENPGFKELIKKLVESGHELALVTAKPKEDLTHLYKDGLAFSEINPPDIQNYDILIDNRAASSRVKVVDGEIVSDFDAVAGILAVQKII